MTVALGLNGVIELSGRCSVEDAETLQRSLLASPVPAIKWNRCEQIHTAVLQILLAAKPHIQGVPASPFLASHIAPLLRPR